MELSFLSRCPGAYWKSIRNCGRGHLKQVVNGVRAFIAQELGEDNFPVEQFAKISAKLESDNEVADKSAAKKDDLKDESRRRHYGRLTQTPQLDLTNLCYIITKGGQGTDLESSVFFFGFFHRLPPCLFFPACC